jgi:hypothetical protein
MNEIKEHAQTKAAKNIRVVREEARTRGGRASRRRSSVLPRGSKKEENEWREGGQQGHADIPGVTRARRVPRRRTGGRAPSASSQARVAPSGRRERDGRARKKERQRETGRHAPKALHGRVGYERRGCRNKQRGPASRWVRKGRKHGAATDAADEWPERETKRGCSVPYKLKQTHRRAQGSAARRGEGGRAPALNRPVPKVGHALPAYVVA